MIEREQLTRDVVIESLESRVCPACGDAKDRGDAVCTTCFMRLPGTNRQALFLRVGDGFEDALFDALDFLQADTFHAEAKP